MAIITIDECNTYFLVRNRKHQWFSMTEISDRQEMIQNAIDKVLYTYPLKNDLNESNFNEQDEAYQNRIKLVICRVIDHFLTNESEYAELRKNGVYKYSDVANSIELSGDDEKYLLGSIENYNLIKPYIKNPFTNLRMR